MLPTKRSHIIKSLDLSLSLSIISTYVLLPNYPTDVVFAPAEQALVYLDDDARSSCGDRVGNEMLRADVPAKVLPIHSRVTLATFISWCRDIYEALRWLY